MKIYLDKNDLGKTITFREEYGKRQYLYVHDKEGFVFKNLEKFQNQKAVECLREVKENVKWFVYDDKKLLNKDDAIENFIDLIDTKIKELEGEIEYPPI